LLANQHKLVLRRDRQRPGAAPSDDVPF
jgi:hypothetical protein